MVTGYILVDYPNPVAQGGFPRRGGFRPSGTCIVHTSEGGWQAGVEALTRLLRTRTSHGSYHRACDWADIALYYPWEWEAWQDTETNNWAVGIAAACKTSDWLAMPGEIREGYYRNMAKMAADFVTYMRETYGVVVPLRRLSGAEARAGVPGFCAHGDSGVSRSDPGRDFDWDKFFEYTRQALGGLSYQGSITPTDNEEDDKVLVIGRKAGEDAVWVGDGVIRRHVPNPRALEDLKWFAENGFLKIKNNGEVFEFGELDGLGVDVVGATRNAVLFGDVDWFGRSGEIPAEGRKTTTLGLQAGWLDTQVADLANRIGGVQSAVEGLAARPVAEVEMGAEDVESLAEQLKAVLAPGLAADLASRLAE